MKRRIIAGMGANSLGMAISIGIQLASLPLFLHYWDASTYGVWLMLSAIPVYLSMADVGMVTAAGNKMTMVMGKGDVQEANTVFHSAQLFMIFICGLAALLIIIAGLCLPVSSLNSVDERVALIALGLCTLLGLLGGLTDTIFRATGRFAIGTLIANAIRLLEWMGSVLGLYLFGSFSAVAIGGLLARCIGTFLAILYSTKHSQGLKWGFADATSAEIREMAKPALAFMVFPLANALSFQGVTLLVGVVLGTSAVALFNTYRTIARVAVQLTGIFSHALAPELSRLFGEGGKTAVERIWLRSAKVGLIQAFGLSVVLYFLSPLLLKVWTHGRIEFIAPLMALMLLYAAVGGAGHIPRAMLSAVNQPKALAAWTIFTSLLVIGLAWLLGNWWQLYGVTLAILIAEALIALICTHLVYHSVLKSNYKLNF